MTMYCLLVTGLVGSIQAVFDLLRLLTSMGGRRTSSTAIKPGSTSDTTTYTTEVTVHPFFDQDLGLAYNVQSTLIIACPIVMLLTAVLAYYSYNEFTTSLFSDEEEALYDNGFGNTFGTYGAPSYGGMRPVEQRPSNSERLPMFSGTGQRLGG
eukprot:g22789.t1